MDRRIFLTEPMGLKDMLLSIKLVDRVTFDRQQQTLFLNFEGLKLRNLQDMDSVRSCVEAACRSAGKKVPVIVNYDSFEIEEDILDQYAAMVQYLTERYYTHVSRYTTSAFLRMKLGEALNERGLAPHIFETRNEALHATRLNGFPGHPAC
ncbi:hypothetical protein C5L14_29580 [Labrys okinawensis]|uniref:STAS domain-containing protein n=1 Tax=Labrys okinawensis TaxID=346911 RepID=A0A2S9Q3T1_9HYPH|nr:hypothetical protein [Labrys okinawensis]PRH84012.1 hypothetical protein C5L14_29580 [Labrys okinawensis]